MEAHYPNKNKTKSIFELCAGIMPYCLANRRGKCGSSDRLHLLGFQSHCGWWLQPWNQKTVASWQERDNKPRQCVEQCVTLLTKACIIKAMVFLGVMYGCDSWTIKKAECQQVDAFELWFRKRLLKVPWTTRWSNHSILREINLEYSVERLMLKLKLQYFDPLIWTHDSLEKSLILVKMEGRRRRGCQRMRWLDGITDAMNMNLGKLQEVVKDRRPGMLQSMGLQVVERLHPGDWTTTIYSVYYQYILELKDLWAVLFTRYFTFLLITKSMALF